MTSCANPRLPNTCHAQVTEQGITHCAFSRRICTHWLARYLQQFDRTLLGLDMQQHFVQSGIKPVDLFRTLHHPRQLFEELDQVAMDFRRGEPLDALLISREPVGGLWNRAPHNLLTLSPGQWMEFAFYPLAQHAAEIGRSLDVNALILKTDLIEYYHRVPERFGVARAHSHL